METLFISNYQVTIYKQFKHLKKNCAHFIYNLYPPAASISIIIYLHENSDVFPLLGGCISLTERNEKEGKDF